jgi:hypothetical protein
MSAALPYVMELIMRHEARELSCIQLFILVHAR